VLGTAVAVVIVPAVAQKVLVSMPARLPRNLRGSKGSLGCGFWGISGAHRDEICSKVPRTVEIPTRRSEHELGQVSAGVAAWSRTSTVSSSGSSKRRQPYRPRVSAIARH
jgi:hypothetical protein